MTETLFFLSQTLLSSTMILSRQADDQSSLQHCGTPACHGFWELYTPLHIPSSLSPSFLKLVSLCWHWALTWCFCKAIIDSFLPRLHCSMAAAAPESFNSYLQAASCWCLPWELPAAWLLTHCAVSHTLLCKQAAITSITLYNGCQPAPQQYPLCSSRWGGAILTITAFVPAPLLLSATAELHLTTALPPLQQQSHSC